MYLNICKTLQVR